MTKETKDHIVRYVISSVTTFLSGFAIAILPLISSGDATSLTKAGLIAILLTGVRGGVKLLLETFLKRTADRNL